MDKGIFVLGTDTDVGKTFVSALILKKIKQDGINAGYFKGVLSGAEYENGNLIPGDCKFVCEIAGIKKNYEKMISYTLKEAVSPHLASKMEGVSISLDKIKQDFQNIKNEFDFVLFEGSGGIVCPISLEDNNIIMLEDLVKMSKLPIILIARAGLGTINHTVLTVSYIKSIGLTVRGIVLNNFDESSIMHNSNKETIEKLTGIKNIVTIPKSKNINNINLSDLGRIIYE